MLFSLGGGGGGGPRQLVLPGPKAVCSTSTCCRIAGCTCLGISSGLPDNSSDPSGPRSITFRDLQPLLQYLFLLGIAVAAPAGPGPEHPGLPAEAPPGTSRPPDQLPAGERWGLSAPLSPGLFRHPHVASRYSQICGHGMPQDATARWKTTHTSSTTSSTRTLPRVRGVLSSTCVSAPSRLRREDFGSETPNCRRRKG